MMYLFLLIVIIVMLAIVIYGSIQYKKENKEIKRYVVYVCRTGKSEIATENFFEVIELMKEFPDIEIESKVFVERGLFYGN